MNRKRLAAAFVAFSLLTGCGLESQGNQALSDSSRIDQINVGITTRAQVRATLGEPENRWMDRGTESWSYSFNRTSTNAAMFVPIAQAVAGRVHTDYVNLIIGFDRNDVVRDVTHVCHRGSTSFLSDDVLREVPC